MEEVQYSEGTPFKLFAREKTWHQAELHCQSQGGHLASVLSKWEDNEINYVGQRAYGGKTGYTEYDNVWIGEKVTSDKKMWSDGAQSTFITFNKQVTREDLPHCILKEFGGGREEKNCGHFFQFICRLPAHKVKTSTVRLEYKKEQLEFSSFQVWYSFRTANKTLLESWKEKRMTGFQLTWAIKEAENETQFQQVVRSAPFAQNEDLQRMVRAAATERVSNKSGKEIIKKAIEKKIDFLRTQGLSHSVCGNEQMYIDFDKFSNELISDQSNKILSSGITKEDAEIGLAIYEIATHCPAESTKIAKFMLKLAKEESLPTFILAITNTLESDQVKLHHKILLGKIYEVLDKLFGLYLGKILLATSSPSQLSAFQDQYLPYFNNSDQHVQECLSGHSCADVIGPIQGTFFSSKRGSYVFTSFFSS